MDIATLAGIAAAAGLLYAGFAGDQLSASLINPHGIAVVVGGTAAAVLINTPLRHISMALSGLLWIFRHDGDTRPAAVVPVLTALAEQARLRGLTAFKEADPAAAGGFLARAAAAALEYNDTNFVRQVLEREINQRVDDLTQIANFYRTMGVMAPMFGLLGTLIGIIGVLKDLSRPESVGPAMAVAITSAFYGIFLSNMVCGPIAGKIQAKAWMETRVKEMVLEGVLEIMKGSLPLAVERRLQAYL